MTFHFKISLNKFLLSKKVLFKQLKENLNRALGQNQKTEVIKN